MTRKIKKMAHEHGAVAEKLDALAIRRGKRGRVAGDRDGVDVGIGSLGARLESILDGAKKDALAEHVRSHGKMALAPILSAIKKRGDDHLALYVDDVGLNMLRTIIEYLEETG